LIIFVFLKRFLIIACVIGFASVISVAGKTISCDVTKIEPYLVTVEKSCVLSGLIIDEADVTIGSPLDASVEGIQSRHNENMKFIPTNFAAVYPNLITIEFWGNPIKVVGKHFKNLHKLQFLTMNENEIETIEIGAFDDLENLELLNFASNNVESVDGKLFKNLKKLEKLYMSGNKILSFAPNIFDTLVNLKGISFERNQLTSLDEHIFDKLVLIKTIHIGQNVLEQIPEKLFSKNVNAVSIGMYKNKIKSLAATTFDNNPKLYSIDLRENVCIDKSYTHETLFDYGPEIPNLKKDLLEKCKV
jgi:hypothetical protein